MHNVYLVLLWKGAYVKNGKLDSEAARLAATSILETEGFCETEGYFTGGKGDWFVVGGRWSGLLTKVQGKKVKPDKSHMKEELKKLLSYGWKKEKAVMEVMENDFRNSRKKLGYPDDAQIMTAGLIEGIKKAEGVEDMGIFDAEEHCEKSRKDLSEDDIGKVVVVIDYHY